MVMHVWVSSKRIRLNNLLGFKGYWVRQKD